MTYGRRFVHLVAGVLIASALLVVSSRAAAAQMTSARLAGEQATDLWLQLSTGGSSTEWFVALAYVENRGGLDAEEVVVSFRLPEGAQRLPDGKHGTSSSECRSGTTCLIPRIPAGSGASVAIIFKPGSETFSPVRAEVASRTPELNAADNGASATPVIAQPAPLGMPNLPRTPLPEAHVDAREIAFNRGIGDVRLGMTRAGVGVAYGQPARVENVRGFFPRGTRYFGKVLRRLTYRFNDGTLRVSLVGNRVRAVDTTSRYYRSPGGVGVGSLIPLGPCRKNRFGSCDHRWKGFIYEPVCGKAWLAGTKRVQSIMYARRGRVTAVQIGDPNVILYCF